MLRAQSGVFPFRPMCVKMETAENPKARAYCTVTVTGEDVEALS
jgi:hypothetical protein